ncbi:proline-rich protein HaeIII subfamily 1-like [Aphelocoma coerulescens]|uniref:proline-rich protein HaeIII subfamily 1-like n=1 Tax=Aphelocoma coerulescens TaxID=39617 RepID=UPI00360443BF
MTLTDATSLSLSDASKSETEAALLFISGGVEGLGVRVTLRRLRGSSRSRVRGTRSAAWAPSLRGTSESRNPGGLPGARCTRSHPRQLPGAPSDQPRDREREPRGAREPRGPAPLAPPRWAWRGAPGACCCDERRPRPLLVHGRPARPALTPFVPSPRPAPPGPLRPAPRASPLVRGPRGTPPAPGAPPRPRGSPPPPPAPICSRRRGGSCAGRGRRRGEAEDEGDEGDEDDEDDEDGPAQRRPPAVGGGGAAAAAAPPPALSRPVRGRQRGGSAGPPGGGR